MVDALAILAEEGRGKLRKAADRCKQPLTRIYPNGWTLQWLCTVIYISEYRGAPGELKHLSTQRKSNQTRFSK